MADANPDPRVVAKARNPICEYALPRAGYKGRWTADRKAAVVAAVEGGVITLDQARVRWALSLEEYMEWRTKYVNYGPKGLRLTRLKEYR